MRTNWRKPKITRDGSLHSLVLPDLIVRFEAEDLEDWRRCRETFRNGSGRLPSRRAYWELFESGCLHFAHPWGRTAVDRFRANEASYGFCESFIAVALREKGFQCWTGARLVGPLGTGKSSRAARQRIEITEEIEALLQKDGLASPRTFIGRVKSSPKGAEIRLADPDVVARHPDTREWRFFEAKRRREGIRPGQAEALAFLHLLTGAPISIIRLWKRGADVDLPRQWSTQICYDGPTRD